MATLNIEMEQLDRMKARFEALRAEYQVCKRKLESKCQALMIISKELDHCRSERDQFKLMAEQLQERYQNIKRQLGQPCYSPSLDEAKSRCSTNTKNLGSSLFTCKERNKSLEFEVEDFKQKLHDANGDIKLLREQIARQRVGTSDEGINIRHFPAHEREDLVKQLEASREEINQLERDLQQVIDEKEELVIERVAYKSKYDRLNQELNYILKGDEKRIVDIDALSMENKYLQESLKQMAEEKSMAMATVSKYKNLLERRKTKSSSLKLGQSRSGGLVITQKQVHQILEDHSQMAATPQAMSDLQALASALLETVNDKNLALSHQRKTNKILGNRVSELEKKIKTLEVAGLWNVPSSLPNLEKLRAECEDVKTLIPLMSQSSDDTAQDTSQDIDHYNNDNLECDLYSPSSSELTSPTHCSYSISHDNSLVHHEDIKNTNVNRSYMQIHGVSTDYGNSAEFLSPVNNAVSMDDLDLLPTKEEIVKCTERDDLKQSNLLSSGGQLADISMKEQQNEETVTEDKLKSLMDDVTNKMVAFSHKTKSHGQFIIETSVDYNQQSEDSQTDVSMKSKNIEEEGEPSTVACNNQLIKETLTHISNENEC
ncbi:coiled-coil domain-containing protein 149-like [Mytilus californianus]|uniref:coiled-coil domain-containing protein 149-like n=1 Tax=Mytilus californianus TaxID=6549 RepID=UPI00224508F3|nr:coiled-coil domain-containing protein 149-like [Mytilus californianus]